MIVFNRNRFQEALNMRRQIYGPLKKSIFMYASKITRVAICFETIANDFNFKDF